jgi:hypothetical protein
MMIGRGGMNVRNGLKYQITDQIIITAVTTSISTPFASQGVAAETDAAREHAVRYFANFQHRSEC